MAKRILILASGTGSLAAAILQSIQDRELDLEVARVISDRPAPVLDLVKKFGVASTLIEYSKFESRATWSAQMENVVASDKVDLVVSVGFMRILPASFIEKFSIINIHPALLPLFPGAHAIRDALLAGATESGTTVHWMDSGVDTGKVISQIKVQVEVGDTEESLHERIKIQERNLIVETLKRYAHVGLEK
ncbi:MAG: phosphoribosylglycinamide formyltransferase [Actinomycetes bacterium]